MSDIDLDAVEARCRDWRDYHAGKELVLALIARVREQEQEIARLTQDARRWRWARAGLFVTPHPDGEPVVSYQSGSMDEVAAKLYASLPKTPRGIVRDVTPVFDAAIAEKARG